MIKHLLTLILSFITISLSAQLVITEISYNPPESGTDSLEYIEIYNASNEAIDLTGYFLKDNNTWEITEGMVPAEGYIVYAVNANAMQSVLGVEAIQWADLALSNGGETISIEDPQGNLIDLVTYDSDEPWPTFENGTDGGGASIELCNINNDNNDPENWRAAENDLGVEVNSRVVRGTPGAANTATCELIPDVVVEVTSNVFTPRDITINVGETVRWVNLQGSHNVNGSQSVFPNNPESFGNGPAASGMWTYDYTFQIEGVYDYQCDPHVNFGMVGTVTVLGEPTLPLYDISIVNTVDGDGVADSIGVVCRVSGVTHGINFRPSGLQFTLIDESGDGIGVFSNNNLGYNYAEGDEILITGQIDQFNGLTQIEPSEIEVISSGNDLQSPTPVTMLDESTESRLVVITDLNYVDESQWEGDGGNFNVIFTDGSNEYVVRIDADTDLASMAAPSGPLEIIGLGGQFDNSSPFFDGYQLFPRYSADITTILSSENLINEAEVILYPNPSVDYIFLRYNNESIDIESFEIFGLNGATVMSGNYRSKIDVSELPSGNYILKLRNQDSYGSIPFYKN